MISFRPFDLDDPFDPTGLLDSVPDGVTSRGMFFEYVLDAYTRAGKPKPRRSYQGFRHYPVRDYLELMLQTAEDVAPEIPLARTLHDIGFVVYPNLAASMVGKAIFAVAGRDYLKVVRLAAKAYEMATSRGDVQLHESREGFVHAELRGVYDYLPYTVGIWSGGMEVCSVRPTQIEVAQPEPGTTHLRLHWSPT